MDLENLTEKQLREVNEYIEQYVVHKEEQIQDWSFHIDDDREVEFDNLQDSECGDEMWYMDYNTSEYFDAIEDMIDHILIQIEKERISVLTPNGKVVEISKV